MKRIFFTTILLIFSITVCFSQNQSKAPEAGTYKGFTSSSTLTSTTSTYGAGVDNTTYSADSRLMPSIFGDLIIYKNGTYKLTNAGETGKCNYNPAINTVTFTGKLSTSKVKYNYLPEYLNFQISFPYEGKFINMSFSKKREIPFIKPEKPNDNFGGSIVAETKDRIFNIIDVQSGKSLTSNRGYHPSKNINGEIAALSAFNDSSDVYVYSKTGELKYTISGPKIISSGAISKYYAVSLSPNGNYLALAGTALGFAISGDPVYVIIDKEGKTLVRIAVNSGNLWASSWTAENQCLISGTEKVVLVNPLNSKVSALLSKSVDAAALNNYQQKVIFDKNNRLSILDTGTGKEEPFAAGRYDDSLSGYSLYSIVWSSDEKSAAVSVKNRGATTYKILLLAVDGSNAKILADENGDDLMFSSNYIGY